MPKVKVTIKQTQSGTFDTGDIPANMVRDLLQKRADGTFDGNWGLVDVARGTETWETDSIVVEEL